MEIKKKVQFSDCILKPELSLMRVLEIVQDMVSETLDEMGSNNIMLRNEYHAMWVFTKNKIHAERNFKWNEEMTVCCRSVKSNKIRNYMLTEFKDKDGNVCITSLLECCVIDIETFRFRKLDSIPFVFNDEEIDTNMTIKEIEISDCLSFKVEPLMIDYSKHLNNTQSLRIFLNSFSIEELDNIFAPSYDFVIHYLSQAVLGENLVLKKGKEDNLYGYSITKEDGTQVAKAILKIN